MAGDLCGWYRTKESWMAEHILTKIRSFQKIARRKGLPSTRPKGKGRGWRREKVTVDGQPEACEGSGFEEPSNSGAE